MISPNKLNIIGSCLSPTRIFNKNTRTYEYVSCGKCVSCLNKQADKQSIRVNNEMLQHKYSLFFTLTYNNESLPRYEAFSDKNGVLQLRPIGRIASEATSCPFNYRDINGNYTFEDDLYLPKIEKESTSYEFAVVWKKDIQNFMKRLRKKIDNLNLPNDAKRIRYYIASEYGPRTNRPHYHGLIFFDDQRLLAEIKNIIVSSWGLFERQSGRRNLFKFRSFASCTLTSDYISLAGEKSAYYVAQYVASNTALPKALRQRDTKPFHLQSKAAVIGSFKVDRQEVLEHINRGTLQYRRTRYNGKAKVTEECDLPLSQDILSSLFRKCYEFNDLSISTKYATYSFYGKHIEEWKSYIREKIIILKHEKNECYENFKSYLRVHKDDTFRRWLFRSYSRDYALLSMEKDATYYAAKNAYKVTQQLDFQKYYPFCDKITAYLRMFDKYLYLVQMRKLNKFYETLEYLIKHVGYQSAMLHAFPFMIEHVPFHHRASYLPSQRHFLPEENINEKVFMNDVMTFSKPYHFVGFSSILNVEKIYKMSIQHTQYFKTYKAQQQSIFNKRSKNKKVNNTHVFGYRAID